MKRHLTEKVKRLREYVPVVGSAYRKLRELRESRQQVVRQLNEVLNQRAELDRHLDEAQRQHTELTRQLDEAQRQRTELGRQLDQAQSQRAELGRQLDEAKRDRAQLLEYLDISPYSRWIREHEGQRQANLNVPGLMPGLGCPKISVILTVCDPEPDYLARAVESVTKQSNRNWELCISDDASCRADVRALLVQMAANDCRVKVLFRDERGGFSAANNSAFKLVTAEFVTFLDHADLLAPRSLELCAAFLALHPETEILYSDEDEIDEYERRSRPYFKPDYSPELIHSCNYMSHLTVHRAKNIESVDGWRSAYDGAEDYDLLLRILDLVDGKDVRHLPEILYHRRTATGATSFNPAFLLAGKRSLQDTFARRGIAVDISVAGDFLYRTRYRLRDPRPKVSIIIPTRDRPNELEACLVSVLSKTTYPNYDITIMDNGSESEQTKNLFKTCARLPNVRVVSFAGPFNFSAINNKAASLADG